MKNEKVLLFDFSNDGQAMKYIDDYCRKNNISLPQSRMIPILESSLLRVYDFQFGRYDWVVIECENVHEYSQFLDLFSVVGGQVRQSFIFRYQPNFVQNALIVRDALLYGGVQGNVKEFTGFD